MLRTILVSAAAAMLAVVAVCFGQVANEEGQIPSQEVTKIEHLAVRPRVISANAARLEVSFDVIGRVKADEDIRVEANVVELRLGGESSLQLGDEAATEAATFANTLRCRERRVGDRSLASASFEMVIQNPKLWWPSGMGDRSLYQLELTAYFANEGVLDAVGSAKAAATFGIREISHFDPCVASSRLLPRVGYAVPFQVNSSLPLFVKGAVWSRPRDLASGRREFLDELIGKAEAAGLNTLLVRADPSEEDDFYSLCDRRGLLVAQELPSPSAAGVDEDDGDYLQRCADLLGRLKSHPSVAFWTVGEASAGDVAELEKLCADIAPGSMFLPGMSGQGDVVVWGTSLAKGGRRCCEFGSSKGGTLAHWNAVVLSNEQGTVSTPVTRNLKDALGGTPLDGVYAPFSAADRADAFHDPAPHADTAGPEADLLWQMGLTSSALSLPGESYYKAARELAKNAQRYDLARKGVCGLLRSSNYLDKYIAVTQLEQAATTQRVVEAWRRRGFEGSGLFLGKLGESEASISESIIDWRGTPKPGYYFLKRAMRDVLICADFHIESSEPLTATKSKRFDIDVYVLNSTAQSREGFIASAKVFATNMLMLSSKAVKTDAPSFSSTYAFTLECTAREGLQDSMLFVRLGLTDKSGNPISSNFYALGALPAAKAFPDVDVLLISDRRYEIESALTFLDDSGMDLTYVASSDELTKAAPVYADYTNDFTDYGDEEWSDNTNLDAMDPYARRGYTSPGDPYVYPTNEQGGYDKFGDAGMGQATTTAQTTTAEPPKVEDVYDVIVIDAAACKDLDEDKMTAIKSAVEKGCGLLISGVGKDLAGTAIESISPVELVTKGAPDVPNVVAVAVPDHPVLADLPSDEYLQSLGSADVVSLNGTDHNALDGNGSILISAGHSTPILAESSYGEGRILAFVPGFDPEAADAFRGMWASMIAYLAKLSYPEMRRAREIQSTRPYAGLNMLPEGELEASVVNDDEGGAHGPNKQFVVDIRNRSKWLAFQVHLDVRREPAPNGPAAGKQPVNTRGGIEAAFSDNYFSLIPNERRRIEVTLPDDAAWSDGGFKCVVSAWNTNTIELPLRTGARRAAYEAGPKLQPGPNGDAEENGGSTLDEGEPAEQAAEIAPREEATKKPSTLMAMLDLARDYLSPVRETEAEGKLRIKPLGATRPPQVAGAETGVSVGRYDILELSFELNPPQERPFVNPFQDVEVSVAFTSPSGRRGLRHPSEKSGREVGTVPVKGFYDGGNVWRVRFAPDEVGRWTYTVLAKLRPDAGSGGELDRALTSGEFECVESGLHGFIEVDPKRPRRLSYYDGTPFMVAGGGAFSPWQTHVTGALDWEDYLERHSRNRLNNVRLYLYQEHHRGPRRKIVISVMEEGSTDRYDLVHAQRLDRFMSRARELGVTAILVFFDHWPMVHDWDKSVFNVANGGPCVKTAELFTNRTAIQIQKKMIDYVVARWGAYDNLLAWEFWNECNIVPDADIGKNKSVMVWHREMSKFLADIDPYGHIQFTSFCSGVVAPDWYIEPWNEIISYHHYAAYDGGDEKTVDDDFDLKLNEFRKIEKPIIIAELGYKKYAGDVSEAKKDYLRIATWAAFFQGYGFILWDDTDFRILPGTRKYISYLMKFADENRLSEMDPLAAVIEPLNNDGLRIWFMEAANGEDRFAAYIHSFEDHSAAVKDACFAFNVRRGGEYMLKWYDPKRDVYISETEIEVKGGLAIVQIPEFKTDIALAIERRSVGGLVSTQEAAAER